LVQGGHVSQKILGFGIYLLCHEFLFLETHLMSQKKELTNPVNLSLSDLNLDPHVKTFEILKRAWIKMSGCLHLAWACELGHIRLRGVPSLTHIGAARLHRFVMEGCFFY